jgi:hypothetical protein
MLTSGMAVATELADVFAAELRYSSPGTDEGGSLTKGNVKPRNKRISDNNSFM